MECYLCTINEFLSYVLDCANFLDFVDCCQANVEQSRQSVFPVPVGDSVLRFKRGIQSVSLKSEQGAKT